MDWNHHSLGQKVFDTIREDILSGRYQKDDSLKEVIIGKELGVSRTPVREALRQLELEGLIEIIPNKGAYVIGFTIQDIQDIYEMRSLLDGLCAERAALRATAEQIDRMEEILYLTEFHIRKGHMEQMMELDSMFHSFLYEAGDSKILEHALKNYLYYLKWVRKASLAYHGRAAYSCEEHKKILKALKAHDANGAREAAGLHMKNTIKNIDDYGWDKIITERRGNENGKD